MCNLLMNGEMSADLISEAEHKGQSEKQGANNDNMSDTYESLVRGFQGSNVRWKMFEAVNKYLF